MIVQSRSQEWVRWRAWKSTLGAWWDAGKPVEVMQPIAGFSGHTVHVAPEVALGDGPQLTRIHVRGRCRETGALRVSGKGLLPEDTPCWCLELSCSHEAPTLWA